MHRSIMALFGAVVLGVTVLAASSPANAATYWVIRGFGSQKCIDNPNYASGNVQLDIWSCVSPRQSNEQWEWVPAGDDSFIIVNRSSGKCLTVYGASYDNNAPIIQYACNYGANQRWFQDNARTTQGGYDYYMIRNAKSQKCIAVQNASTANGAKLLQYTCNTGPNEIWTWLG
ncbi:RICIN domain-containing protein [Sphaerisporangium sp. NPDC005288]|uniref:RICIN domain-containing protein n=1 Tax=Sphaerisporangium sp. NPDC005288 TaxID=3155114 RepID=UPI0033BA6EEB